MKILNENVKAEQYLLENLMEAMDKMSKDYTSVKFNEEAKKFYALCEYEWQLLEEAANEGSNPFDHEMPQHR